MKIVWIRMYDDSAANDIGYCKLWCNCGEQCHYLRKEVADHRRALGAGNYTLAAGSNLLNHT